MERLARLFIKHGRLCFLLFFVFLGIPLMFALNVLGVNSILALVIYVVFMFIIFMWIFSASAYLLEPCLKALANDCDPVPLLYECEAQLTLTKGVQRNIIAINKCVALTNMGEYNNALELLLELKLDFDSKTPNNIKYIYCHNIADIYYDIKEYENFKLWYHKAVGYHNSLKPSQQKSNVNNICYMNVQKYMLEGQFEKAAEELNKLVISDRRGSVVNAYALAEVYLAMGESEKAKEKLRFVVENGNRLYIVAKAKKHLEKM